MPNQLEKHEGRFAEIKTLRERKYYGILAVKEKIGDNEKRIEFVVDVVAQFPLRAKIELEQIAKENGAKLVSVHPYK